MKTFKRILIKIIKGLLITILIALFIASIQYYHTEIYNFSELRPFSGNKIYNPYENYEKQSLRANFHAHSNAYNNLTNGAQASNVVINHYLNNGYDIISLSDYNKINSAQNPNYINAYEHGVNIGKKHQLVINSDYVKHFDFPLTQSKHHKQQVIKKIKHHNALVALAHPTWCDGYTADDMKNLRGIDHIEVKNHYKSSTRIWDDALSAGNLVWALSNDDCHDITKDYYTFVNWNRIGVKNNTKENVINALKQGNHYAVSNRQHMETNYLDSCVLDGSAVRVYFSENADLITFIGDYGMIKAEAENARMAAYTIKPEDTYVRIEARTGSGEIYLNPLVRYNGINIKKTTAYPPVNPFLTILYRVMILFSNSLIVFFILILNGNLSVQIRSSKARFRLKLPGLTFDRN